MIDLDQGGPKSLGDLIFLGGPRTLCIPCKELGREIMNRSNLRKKFNRNRNHENCNFKFQRNYCISLLRKTKKKYKNLSVKTVMDNQTFWKTVKPYFSDKQSNSKQ